MRKYIPRWEVLALCVGTGVVLAMVQDRRKLLKKIGS